MKNNKKIILFVTLLIIVILFLLKVSDTNKNSQPVVQEKQKVSETVQVESYSESKETTLTSINSESAAQFEEVQLEVPFAISVTQALRMSQDRVSQGLAESISPTSFEEGKFFFLPANATFHARLNAKKPMTQDDWQEVVSNLEDEGIDKQGIVFHFGSDKWKSVKEPGAFRQLLKELSEQKEAVKLIVVRGHADAKGSDEYNIDLSRKRAFTVAQDILSLPVMVDAVGESEPVASNSDSKGRAQNRRVEIYIILNKPKE